ncbi:MAG: hypothetical protein J2P45_04355 [Candidatus Dormibacteraeota bacterium]|nr:hypothetical protein [Candidatus Dormibacteraeota bacterium]
MVILRIEHPVPDFARWKQAFDNDPVGRVRSGVRRYQVLRSIDDPNYVLIDLEFDTSFEADALLAAMRRVWSQAGHSASSSQQARIAEAVETRDLRAGVANTTPPGASTVG